MKVLLGNRKGKTQNEKLPLQMDSHLGSVRQVQRNPAFLKNWITADKWCAKVWSEECRTSCIIETSSGSDWLTDVGWSLTRPSVFFTAKSSGSLEIWDLLYHINRPLTTVKIRDSALTSVQMQESGTLLAVGSDDGTVSILQISSSLRESDKNDRISLSALFERETRREKVIEGKNKEEMLQKKMKENQRPTTAGDSSLLTASSSVTSASPLAEHMSSRKPSEFDQLKHQETEFLRLVQQSEGEIAELERIGQSATNLDQMLEDDLLLSANRRNSHWSLVRESTDRIIGARPNHQSE